MKSSVHIAVIAPTDPAEFFDLLWEGVWSATFELSPFGVQIDTFKTLGHDIDAQTVILSELLDARYAAIAIVAAHSSRLNTLIARHTDNGTRVVTFNTDAPASARYSFVGPDGRQGGALAGELLGKLMGGRGKLISFPGVLDRQHLAARYDGLHSELRRAAPAVAEVACHHGPDAFDDGAAELFARHPDVGGVYVGCSRVFQVGAVMERLGLRVPCVGFNNTEAVRPLLQAGWVAAVIEESAYQQGYIALQRAYESTLTAGGERPGWVRIPSTVVFRSNADEAAHADSLNEAFELLIRQRTIKLRSYQEQLEDANVKLSRLAETDALTGLLNRRKFEEIMDAQVKKSGESSPMALLMVDLDAFKAYNDSYGHHVGDEALRTAARVLETCSRTTDFCARLGGDEFCVLLPGANPATAEEVKSRILAAVRELRIAPQTLALPVRLSIGMASIPEDALTAEDLIVAADKAMYSEKRRERSRMESFEYAAPL